VRHRPRYRVRVADLARAAAWHRRAAAVAAAADRAGVAEAELPGLRARLLAQQTQVAEAAARRRAPLPVLVPSAGEISAAGGTFGNLSADSIAHAMRDATEDLNAADAELAALLAPPRPAPRGVAAWRPGARNGLVYGGYAAFVLVIQLALLATVDEERTLPLLAPVCLLILPAFAWAAGWLTVGAAFREPGAVPVTRTPRLGAVICLAPNALLCAGLGVLFLARLAAN
jgi:hypothetical protein